MKNERRNDKEHQRQRLLAHYQAEQVIHELHRFSRTAPASNNINVGQIISLAASMGLLQPHQRQPPVLYAIA